MLLAKKADVNAKNNDGLAPLHWASMNGHLGVVEALLGAPGAAAPPPRRSVTFCGGPYSHPFRTARRRRCQGRRPGQRALGVSSCALHMHETALRAAAFPPACFLCACADPPLSVRPNSPTGPHFTWPPRRVSCVALKRCSAPELT